jgi:DNA-binding XRE family transcriptional regulator
MKVNLELLATARREKDISQLKMANLLGYKTKGAYNKVEKGVVHLRMDQAIVIVRALELKAEEVYEIFFANDVA